LSRPDPGWAGPTSRVTALVQEHVKTVDNLAVYLCGNGGMIKDVTDFLRSKGLARSIARSGTTKRTKNDIAVHQLVRIPGHQVKTSREKREADGPCACTHFLRRWFLTPFSMIAPHRSTRKLKTQDGRHLRRYERRWLVERFFAWLQWKRRLLIRWEYYTTNLLRIVQLACIAMLLKQF